MRGQAALEFLTTYGWAILVVLLAIGALGYYGIYNPGDSQPESCMMSPGLACGGYQLTTTGSDAELTLYLKNSFGKQINLQKVTIEPGFDYTTSSCDDLDLGGQFVNEEDEAVIVCTYGLSQPISDDEKEKLSVSLTYRDADGVYDKTAEGDIVVSPQVQAAPMNGSMNATCGDGNVDAGEDCDNGPANGFCPLLCSASCTTNNCALCGDGNLDAGEQCDAGGANGPCPANCSASCTFNSCGGVCGDGNLDAGEQCDAGPANGACPFNCSMNCTLNSCGGVCGDGNLDAGEQCDFGLSNGVCPFNCSSNCTFNTCGGLCGDGNLDAGELCDAGPGNGACPHNCSLNCTLNSCGGLCGDGNLDAGEACDAGPGNGACPHNCSMNCTLNSCGAFCGNDIKEGTEVCDGTDLGGWECYNFGVNATGLACLPDCSNFDYSACFDCPVDCVGNGDDWCAVLPGAYCTMVCGYCS